MEIERKWLIKNTPNLNDYDRNIYERYFIFLSENVEIRVQKINDKYELERKENISEISRSEFKCNITKEEFEHFKSLSNKKIIRDAYTSKADPNLSIKIYHEEYEGLKRVEVEFKSKKEAHEYIPPNWFGKEITGSELGRDKKLVGLNKQEFNKLLNSYSN